jgi:hypothetical protein
MSPRREQRLKVYIEAHPFKTAKELKQEIPGWGDISVRTIQRVLLQRLGLPARRAAQKPLLTPAMVKKRLAFCKKHMSWTEEDWEQVVFSDEAIFRIINPRPQTVRRSRHMSRYLQKYTRKTVRYSAGVMIWACFSGKGGWGSIYFLPPNTTMNADRYRTVLETKLFPWVARLNCKSFLQDGAPCHKAKKVTELLARQSFSVMDWPGNSPDLNPIENLWSIMKARLKGNKSITSLPKLMSAIRRMWTFDIDDDLLRSLARSMPSRLRSCLRNNGQMTKY